MQSPRNFLWFTTQAIFSTSFTYFCELTGASCVSSICVILDLPFSSLQTFVLSETADIKQDPQCSPRRSPGKTKLTVSRGTSHQVFCYTSQLKTRKKLRKNRLLYSGWPTNLPRFQVARPFHVRVESSCCCFPKELVSFDPRHMTRSPRVGRYNIRRGFKSSSKPQVQ